VVDNDRLLEYPKRLWRRGLTARSDNTLVTLRVALDHGSPQSAPLPWGGFCHDVVGHRVVCAAASRFGCREAVLDVLNPV
jgi:hypothetical protein